MTGPVSRRVVVAGLIRDAQGRLFVARRRPGRHLAGLWEFPGRKVEPPEQPTEALARELAEELALQVEIGPYFGTFPFRDDIIDIDLVVYEVQSWSGSPTLVDHDQAAWLPVDRLDEVALTPADIPVASALARLACGLPGG